MSRLKKFEEKKKQLSRFQALKSIFSSLLITVTAVVMIVVVTPKSPEADIQSLEAFNNAIIYTINVTDMDNAIIEDTLIVTLENQFEEYETRLEVGNNNGRFLDLEDDTEYKLKVLADKGYGLEVLDSQTIKTFPVAGGIIISSELLEEGEWSYIYQFEYLVNDIFNEYKNIQVRYGSKYPGEPEVLHYSTMPLSLSDRSFIIEGLDSNMEVFIYLEAITQEDNTVVLDDLSFLTPFELYASLSATRVSHTSAEFSVWLEDSSDLEVEYEVLLKTHDYIVDRIEIVQADEEEDHFHHGAVTVEFLNLLKNQEYTAVLLAKYHDPITKEYVEVEVNAFDFVTLTNFEVDIVVVDSETYIEVTITLEDHEDRYTNAFYSIWEVTEFGTWVYESTSYEFSEIDGEKTVTFTFSIPALDEIIIDIGILDTSQFYYKIILETIDNTEEVSEWN